MAEGGRGTDLLTLCSLQGQAGVSCSQGFSGALHSGSVVQITSFPCSKQPYTKYPPQPLSCHRQMSPHTTTMHIYIGLTRKGS